uniref:Uncharacterized protein n=1 Tax=viral metagenome TaxID=1070528 RepID=A0A6M3J9B8_9ZZZZ
MKKDKQEHSVVVSGLSRYWRIEGQLYEVVLDREINILSLTTGALTLKLKPISKEDIVGELQKRR